jgi:bleomycin hydrolase
MSVPYIRLKAISVLLHKEGLDKATSKKMSKN